MYKIYNEDCMGILKDIPSKSIDSIVTDPPYELNYMRNKWDSAGISYSVDLWKEALRVLKPGGYMVVFSAPRTYHRVTCAIEDAGFDIKDSLFWCYSSGMPKSKDMGIPGLGMNLKPSYEPIILARRKFWGTTAECIETYGVGGLNIDSCRVPGVLEGNPNRFVKANGGRYVNFEKPSIVREEGRWPPNMLLSHTQECEENKCTEDCPIVEINKQSKDSSRYFPVFKYHVKATKKDRGDENNHPTVKPQGLMEWVIKLITPNKGVILDPFMGSGTTGVVALQQGMNFTGIEINKDFFEISKNRLDNISGPENTIEKLFSK